MVPLRPADVGKTLEGVQLEHFILEEFIGGGGMGAVFRGLDTSLGRVVAVKVVSSRNTDDETLRRFRNEAQSAARLDHPNIARVYYVGEDAGWNFIVFEFIEGVNLRDLVDAQGPLSIDAAIRYTLQIADALTHAVEREVVHRDIKPSNILIRPNGQAKLVDMGLARLQPVGAPATDLTASGVTLGTFDYISPEQARDPRSADVRSDLYSLGCTLYFMLTTAPPFPDGTVLQKLLSHSGDSPPDVREARPEIGDEIAGVVRRLMAKQPGQRFQTPQALSSELLVVADQLGLEALPTTALSGLTHPHTAKRLQWHLPWLVSFGLLILVGGILQTIWNGPSQIVPPPPLLLEAEDQPAADPDSPENGSVIGAGTGADAGRSVPRVPEMVRPGNATASELTSRNDSLDPSSQRPVGDSLSNSMNPQGTPLEDGAPLSARSEDAVEVQDATARTTLVVSSTGAEDDDERTVPSLTAALERLGDLPEVDTIELRVQRLEERPLTIDLRRTLTIRAGQGFQPEIVFRPSGGTLLPELRLVRLLGNHRIAMEGLHWRLELPYEPSPECSLFHLNEVDKISMSDCTMTIRNEFTSASFFSIHAPRMMETITGQDEQRTAPPPSIELRRTIARGQASLVRASDGLPFWLDWNQGLFASSERMVEVGGLPAHSRAEIVRIDLTNVTASMDQGFCRVEIDDNGPFLPAIDIKCHKCVITHNGERPLVEHVGVDSLEEAQENFHYSGQQNYYESTEIRWSVRATGGREHHFAWADRDGIWYDEHFADRVVRWSNEYRIKPAVASQTPHDYRLDASHRHDAGFDEAQLPVLPATPPLPGPASGEPSPTPAFPGL